MLGWNDLPERTPVPLDEIASLRRFKPATFVPLGTWRYLTSTPYRHTFDFYRRPRPAHGESRGLADGPRGDAALSQRSSSVGGRRGADLWPAIGSRALCEPPSNRAQRQFD
jgi:hypothetical protein